MDLAGLQNKFPTADAKKLVGLILDISGKECRDVAEPLASA
ncbi:hypothetical protein [Mastigocoleus sp. MO_188.B34]|nr:hypothetical protein [Mastigocoleus sp. MO_188.B34]MDJ0696997.1 hypothetical protein [Mastigocoleus sp. MO_188.B34]